MSVLRLSLALPHLLSTDPYPLFTMTSKESKVASLRSASKMTRGTQFVYSEETPCRSTKKEVPPSMAKTVTIWDKEGSESPTLKSRKGRVALWRASVG